MTYSGTDSVIPWGMTELIRDISVLGLEELKALLLEVLEDNARLKAENAALREEIARLKGLKGRPELKPSGMEKATEPSGATGGKRKERRGAKRGAIDETRILKPDSLPDGARFKGYEDFIVQDSVIMPWTVRYRRERWLLPSGDTVVAALPKGVSSHFGLELKRPVGERGAVEIDALAGVNLGLPVKRTVIGVFAESTWATRVSVGMPASISRAGAGACTTAPSQARQAYFGLRVTMTLNWAGVTSSLSERSSPMTCMAPPQHGQAVLSGSMTISSRGRWDGSLPRLTERGFLGDAFSVAFEISSVEPVSAIACSVSSIARLS